MLEISKPHAKYCIYSLTFFHPYTQTARYLPVMWQRTKGQRHLPVSVHGRGASRPRVGRAARMDRTGAVAQDWGQ